MARRNTLPRTPPTAIPATAAFLIGAGPLLSLLAPTGGPLVCSGVLGLAILPDGLDPGIDINDELNDAADAANGEALFEVTVLELASVNDVAAGRIESLAAGSGESVETGCCDG